MKNKIILLVFVILIFSMVNYLRVFAGSTYDIGTVPGTPTIGQVNWIAWLDKNVGVGGYPSEILTEDNTNSGTGVDQGYQNFGGEPNPNWILQVENFSNETNGDSITILLGGLGDSSGYIWRDTFTWDQLDSNPTDQGEASEISTNQACPIMNQGTWDGSQKVINWSGPAGTYHIYRSTQSSGSGNDASNGRFSYLATVTTTGSIGTYTDDIEVESWHIVVPADSNGGINGCHSEESNPNVISLEHVDVRNHGSTNTLLLVIGVMMVLGLMAIMLKYSYIKFR